MNRQSRVLGAFLALGLASCGSVEDSRGMITDVRVVINELVPQNQAQVDEDGNSYDWVELYNPSDRGVDLIGFYVSDNASRPLKHQIPNSMVVEAKGYLVLWADSESSGPRHLPFGLGADGESFLLSDRDGKLIDSVDYGAASTDQAYARFPNGSGDFEWCVIPTPEASNGIGCANPSE